MSSLNTGVAAVIDPMARGAKSCVQISMKTANSFTGILGISMLLYSLWMVGAYFREMDDHRFYFPWFMCAFAAAGLSFCFLTCIGHTAANIRSRICLSSYLLLMFILLLLEILVAADVLLNEHWKEDFPEDRTERFDDFVHYVEEHSEVFRWILLLILFSQVTSFLMAMILKTMGGDYYQSNFNGDDVHPYDRLPLLNQTIQPPSYVTGHPHFQPKKCPEY